MDIIYFATFFNKLESWLHFEDEENGKKSKKKSDKKKKTKSENIE